MPILNVIIGACAFILLLFSLHLFFSRQGNPVLNRLFSIVFLARILQVVVLLVFTSGNQHYFPFILQLSIPFYYAAPVCFYLYIRGFVVDRSSFHKYEWLHFIPATLAVIHVLPWPSSSSVNSPFVTEEILANKQLFITGKTGLFPGWLYYLGRPALVLVYLAASWKIVLSSNLLGGKSWDISRGWVFFCLSFATVATTVSFLPLIVDSPNPTDTTRSWFMLINSCLLVCAIVFVLHNPKLLYGYLFVATSWKTKADDLKKTPPSTPSLSKSTLVPDQVIVYKKAMLTFMDLEKPYLAQDFQILHLAQNLNMPVHHCSFVINNEIGKNFRDWINGYRIRHFIQEYPQSVDKLTIESIAVASGFKSTGTFYNAFKKETGLMPTVYFLKKDVKVSEI